MPFEPKYGIGAKVFRYMGRGRLYNPDEMLEIESHRVLYWCKGLDHWFAECELDSWPPPVGRGDIVTRGDGDEEFEIIWVDNGMAFTRNLSTGDHTVIPLADLKRVPHKERKPANG